MSLNSTNVLTTIYFVKALWHLGKVINKKRQSSVYNWMACFVEHNTSLPTHKRSFHPKIWYYDKNIILKLWVHLVGQTGYLAISNNIKLKLTLGYKSSWDSTI